ncbi:hypothetical protein NP233_g11590 [Leucocoprinus birnbaumii]|uniref:pyranose dehydrogenase (acceptor) n=1 Tax=Leucocoprinus birnbaumii TaxID=56174 RepID=A0AAD5YL61_9AGAR|nr:hypothetical protein NP233_g11590 [Leucocoprinus birnbaumii]
MRTSSFYALITLLSARIASGVVFYDSPDQLPGDVEYDFIIAGGGNGGGVVAARLAENPKWKVLVIEAGPSNEDIFASKVPGLEVQVVLNPLLDWNYTTTPQPNADNHTAGYYRGKILGGCSSHNGLGHTRGSRDDWDHFAEITGQEGFKWDHMLRTMIAGEHYVNDSANLPQHNHFDPSVHGYHGKLFVSAPYTIHPLNDLFLQVPKELPDEFPFVLDVNGGTPVGISWAQFSEDHQGTRSSSATAYIETSHDNLHVLLNTYVTHVLPVQNSTSASKLPDFRGIEFAADEQAPRKTIYAKKEIIVSGGIIGTPQILLNSGIGNRSELAVFGIETIVDNPSVGKNFTDQVSVNVMFNTTLPNTEGDLDEALAQWNKTHTGPLVMPGPLKNQIVWVHLSEDSPAFSAPYNYPDPSPGKNAPHIEVYTNQISATPFPVTGQIPPGLNGTNTVQLSVVNLHPFSRGSITLSSSSPFAAPIIDPGLLSSPADIAILREGIRSAQRLFSAPVFSSSVFDILYPPANIASSDEALEAHIRSDAGPYLHGGCSAMMTPKGASWGVVDPDFSVKGTSGLRVVDASVLPGLPSGHTQASVYGLSEVASQVIKAKWL